MKFSRSIIATLLFGVMLAVVHYVHMRFLKVDVVFYAAISDAIITTALTGIALYYLQLFSSISNFEKGQLIVIWILAGYGFAISVPTVIDRSLSFYILEKIQQRGGGIQQEHIKDVFINEYLPEHRLVDVRLTEQLESGTITIQDGCVMLTPKGDFIASAGRFYRRNLLPKQRLLMGVYTDDLTDPFRDSIENKNYSCQKQPDVK